MPRGRRIAHKRIDFGRYGNNPVCASFRLAASYKAVALAVIAVSCQGQKLRRTEAGIDQTIDVCRVWYLATRFFYFLYFDICERFAPHRGLTVNDQEGSEVHVVRDCLAWDSVFVDKTADGPHILLGALSVGAGINTLLQVININVGHSDAPHRLKILDGSFVAIKR